MTGYQTRIRDIRQRLLGGNADQQLAAAKELHDLTSDVLATRQRELHEENARLRDALSEIAAGCDHPEGRQAQPAFYEAVEWARKIALAALFRRPT